MWEIAEAFKESRSPLTSPPLPASSQCLIKPSLLKWMQLSKEGGVQPLNHKKLLIDHIDLSIGGSFNHLKWLNEGKAHKQPWEAEEQMNHSLPGPPTKICKCLSSHQARNSCKSWSNTTQLISKSQSITYSVTGDSKNSPTQSGSKSCKERLEFNVVFSGIHSTVSDNWASEMFGDFKFGFGHAKSSQSGVKESGSLPSVHSDGWCTLSSCTERVSSYSMQSTSLFISHPSSHQGTPECLFLTNQLENGLNQSITCPSMSSPSSGSLKFATYTARLLGNTPEAVVSKEQWSHNRL